MKRMKYISKWVGIKRRIKVGPVLIRIRSVLGIAYRVTGRVMLRLLSSLEVFPPGSATITAES